MSDYSKKLDFLGKIFGVDNRNGKFHYKRRFGFEVSECWRRKLTKKLNRANSFSKFPVAGRGRSPLGQPRPFWLPASNYYILAAAVAIAFFFLIWGILHEGDEETPWIPAGIGASVILAGAVFLREVVLKNARRRYLLAQKRLDYNIQNISVKSAQNSNKLTLEQNAAIIEEISRKSEAAKILRKLPDGHLEVFEICNEYLLRNEKELQTAGVGSPRIAALRRSREKIRHLHKFHLLAWAEIESRLLTQEAKIRVTIADKVETAQKALTILESALHFYPNEARLFESAEVVREFISSIKISHWIEQAEKAAFKGNNKRAISIYRDALFFLARDNAQTEKTHLIAEKINTEINKLREGTPKRVKSIKADKND